MKHLFSLIVIIISAICCISGEVLAYRPHSIGEGKTSNQNLLLEKNPAGSESVSAFAPTLSNPGPTVQAQTLSLYGRLPLSFEVNQGQTDPQVKFLSRGSGYSLFLTSNEAVLVLSSVPRIQHPEPGKLELLTQDFETSSSQAVLRMKLIGGNSSPQMLGLDELPDKSHYFTGSNPEKWITSILTYAKIKYEKVYPGINLVYYGNQRQLEHDFIIEPGADPKSIQIAFEGPDRIEIDSEGDLVLHVSGGELRLQKPHIYQELPDTKQSISGNYVLLGSTTTDSGSQVHKVGFQVASYDTGKPLIIDPVLQYSTYLGGSASDVGLGIAVDPSNSPYIVGYTNSTSFPGAGSLRPFGGSFDAFVAKLNVAGNAYAYFTFLGGSGNDFGTSITVSAAGNAYVTGYTNSTDFPIFGGLLLPANSFHGGAADAFVVKLSPTGTIGVAGTYSTYLGGDGDDRAFGIAINTSSEAHITGSTTSKDPTGFPAPITPFPLLNAVDPIFDTRLFHCLGPRVITPLVPVDFEGVINAFVTKLNTGGNGLIYSTYLGGSIIGERSPTVTGGLGDDGFLDPGPGNDGVCGPGPGPDGIQGTADDVDSDDVNDDAESFIYGGTDVGLGITTDNLGNAYVTGYTNSADFNFMNNGTVTAVFAASFKSSCGTNRKCDGGPSAQPFADAFAIKMNPSGSFVYATFFGGTREDKGQAITVDTLGNAFITGITNSTQNIATANSFQPTKATSVPAGSEFVDAFVTKFDSTGSGLFYSTYLGGNKTDEGLGIAVDTSGNAYIAGRTESTNFPVVDPLQSGASIGGPVDAFVSKLDPTGSVLKYSTYLGGTNDDIAYGIAVDATGNAYVAGSTSSGNFLTANPPQTSPSLQSIIGGPLDAFVVKFPPPADLMVVSMTAQDITNPAGPIVSGDTLEYLITVRNNGPLTATGVNLIDTLPTGVALVSATPSQGGPCTQANDVVTCPLGTINSGSTATVTIRVILNVSGDIVNTATVTGNETDSVLTNNTLSLTTTVLALADVALTMTTSPSPIIAGGSVTYRFSVVNNGPSRATNVVVFDRTPDGLTAASANQGICRLEDVDPGIGEDFQPVCRFGDLARGATATATFTFSVASSVSGGVTNSPNVTASEPDPDATNNTVDPLSASTPVHRNSDLSITMADAPDPTVAGQNMIYTITVSNGGPSDMPGVVVTDTLPAEVTFVSATGGTCQQLGGTILCNVGILVRNGSQTVTITVTVNVAGTIINTATVTGTATNPIIPPETTPRPTDLNLNNNTATETTIVNAQPSVVSSDLAITQTEDPDPIEPGQNLVYTYRVTNNGRADATNVTLTNVLTNAGTNNPANVKFISALVNDVPGFCNSFDPTTATISCNLRTLINGASTNVTITYSPNVAGIITSVATVTATQPDPNLANNTVIADTTANAVPVADLAVTQTDSVDPLLIGENLTYTIQVVNNGTSEATGVVLTDTLPAGVTLLSSSPGQGTCNPPVSGVITCNIGKLAVGATTTITISVVPGLAGKLTNTASIKGDQIDPISTNDTATVDTSVNLTIGGKVTDSNGTGIPGIFVFLGGDQVNVVATGADGSYSFGILPVANSYVVTPSNQLFVFSPEDQTFSNVNTSLTVNFIAILKGTFSTSTSLTWGIFGDKPVGADYDGDHIADLSVWRSDGNWYISLSSGDTSIVNWGTLGDTTVQGDYDGDGKTDPAVFRNGVWYILGSTSGPIVQKFGKASDVPIPADYDGDGKTDMAFFRSKPGGWAIKLSSGKSLSKMLWGQKGDVLVPADYDGDGKADIGVFRPLEGMWYINLSGGGTLATPWGLYGDVPVPKDYDGDGKADLAVCRPTDGNWYILRSGDGEPITVPLGQVGDEPVPADYDGDGKHDAATWTAFDGTWNIKFAK
jgi:uncharacterized repeat protein (TIGR01451 family)